MECEAFREDLLDVLYGEADPATAHRFNEHQAQCAACREEIASFRRVRHELDVWAIAPRRRLTLSALRPARWLAAAAALVAAAGGALVLAKGEIRYPNGQVALRLAAPAEDASELRRLLAEQEARHQQAIAELRAYAVRPASAGAGAIDREALLEEMRRLIKQSETRQAAAFAAGLTELDERAQAQRRVDMAQVGAGLSYLEGKTGLQAARTTELMGKVLQASQGGR
jgi:hypothetical protein